MKLFEALAQTIQARDNCALSHDKAKQSGDESMSAHWAEWHDKHEARIEALTKDHMPRGSGFDSGTHLCFDECKADRIVFSTSFHHMNEGGFYDGWTEHRVTIKPAFVGGFDMRISGKDRNMIKDYIADSFHHALQTEV